MSSNIEMPAVQESGNNCFTAYSTLTPQKDFIAEDKSVKAPDFASIESISHQTGIESFEALPNGLSLHRNISRNTASLQTDFNSAIDVFTNRINTSDMRINSSVLAIDNPSLQTETETSENTAGAISETSGAKLYPKTGLAMGLNSEYTLQISGEASIDSEVLPQTDSGQTPKKNRRRTRQSQSGENGETISPQPVNPEPTRSRRTQTAPVLAIDAQRSVETREDKLRNDLLDLVESQKSRKILTGTIQGVERSADNPNQSFAVIYHGEFKVIIPSDEAVQLPDDLRGRQPGEVLHYMVTRRLGAEVDYIVKGVDINSGIAAASRLEAMAVKSKQYYGGTDRNGNYLIYEGLSAEARIVSVIRAGIFVDLFGKEIYIPLRELSYQRWVDAAAHFQPGQRVLVKIMKLDRSQRGSAQVTASVKQAAENPYEQALKRYTPGSRYVGTVSMVDTNGVFVSLEGGVDCLCSYPKRGRPPRGSTVTIVIIGVNHEANHIWGAITHVSAAR